MSLSELDQLVQLLSRLPGFGPRSARRSVLFLLGRREQLMRPLAASLERVAQLMVPCRICGNLDTVEPCAICTAPRRDAQMICVVEDVADLWAIERSGAYRGHYHVLGGILSALDGVRPEDLAIAGLVARVAAPDAGISEVILAMNATVEGQSTAHYLHDRLRPTGVQISRLAHGVPMGGELDYIDEGTLATALKARQVF